MKEVTRTFTVDKETKNSIRFAEDPEPGEAPVSNTIYVQKHVIHNLGNPQTVVVTISVP